MENNNCIIAALDRITIPRGLKIASMLAGRPGFWGVKIRPAFMMRLLMTPNPKNTLDQLKGYGKVMADFKLHDIPSSVEDDIAELMGFASIATIHTLGGEEMIHAAVEAAMRNGGKPETIAGVTILTSHDEKSLAKIGLSGKSISDQVLHLATLAKSGGAGAIVCSGHELPAVSKLENMNYIVPGIRMPESGAQDQKRIVTPKQAIKDGATFLVIGREIVANDNPVEALQRCYDSVLEGRA